VIRRHISERIMENSDTLENTIAVWTNSKVFFKEHPVVIEQIVIEVIPPRVDSTIP
jgi:hypothetical protein